MALVAVFEPEEAERWADAGFVVDVSGDARFFRVEFADRGKTTGARMADWSSDENEFGAYELEDDFAAAREILAAP